MRYGYARVSDAAQDHAAQVAELTAAGCERIFSEKRSAAAGRKRPALRQAVDALAPGDVLVVTRLNRLARSARDALNTLAAVAAKGADFQSLREAWADTTTPHGRFIVTVFVGVAELDRELILERTSEGRQAARKRGVRLGRPHTLNPTQRAFVRHQLASKAATIGELTTLLGVSRSTVTRAASAAPAATPDTPAPWHAPGCPALAGSKRCTCGGAAPRGGPQVDLEELAGGVEPR